MIKRNKRSINAIFGKRLVQAAQPDAFWVLPNEYIGFELEVENCDYRYKLPELEPAWTTHNDQSLRNGIEFVLSGPTSGTGLKTALTTLFGCGLDYTMSERTSTHVHINMSDGVDLEQLRAMIALVYIIEPAIFRWADEDRKWCSYCCPLTDMSPDRITALFNDETDAGFVRAVKGIKHEDKYYGLNLTSFSKHGTVEFRYFPCTKDLGTAITWVQFVMEVKKAALSFEGPRDMLSTLTNRDKVVAFIEKHFGQSGVFFLPLLDMEECLTRIATIDALLDIPVKEVNGVRNNEHRIIVSKGMKGVLKTLFKNDPDAVVVARRAPVIDEVFADDLGQEIPEQERILKAAERKKMYDYWDKLYNAANDGPVKAAMKTVRDQWA